MPVTLALISGHNDLGQALGTAGRTELHLAAKDHRMHLAGRHASRCWLAVVR